MLHLGSKCQKIKNYRTSLIYTKKVISQKSIKKFEEIKLIKFGDDVRDSESGENADFYIFCFFV